MGRDLDGLEARPFQNAAHTIGVSEREGTRRIRCARRLRRQVRRCGLERHAIESVFPQRAPADKGKPPVRLEAPANVDEGRDGISEERHAKPRERRVECGRLEWKHLCIGLDEPHPFAPLGRSPGECQHCTRHVNSHDVTIRRDEPRKLQRSFATTTADVENALTRARRQCRQRTAAKRREL